MSIDFEDALRRARPVPAFSNGTEWECWSAGWCDRCAREAPFRNGISNQGCPLILVALSDLTPAEWMEPEPSPSGRPYLGPRAYTCLEFKPRGGGGGGEPRPKPDPPQMDALFPRPERRTRMFVQPPPVTSRPRQVTTVSTTGELL